MANQADYFVTKTKADMEAILNHVEAAQALAAALLQEYTALGGNAVLAGYVWPAGYTQANFESLMYKLGILFPVILAPSAGNAGNHGMDCYHAIANL